MASDKRREEEAGQEAELLKVVPAAGSTSKIWYSGERTLHIPPNLSMQTISTKGDGHCGSRALLLSQGCDDTVERIVAMRQAVIDGYQMAVDSLDAAIMEEGLQQAQDPVGNWKANCAREALVVKMGPTQQFLDEIAALRLKTARFPFNSADIGEAFGVVAEGCGGSNKRNRQRRNCSSTVHHLRVILSFFMARIEAHREAQRAILSSVSVDDRWLWHIPSDINAAAILLKRDIWVIECWGSNRVSATKLEHRVW